MASSKFLGFVLFAALLISFTAAQSPAPAPSNGGGRRISPAPSPKTTLSPTTSPSPSPATALTPESSSSPPSPPPPLADSPSSDSPAVAPSSISDSPSEAPGPAESDAVLNRYAVFGSVAVMLTAAVLIM